LDRRWKIFPTVFCLPRRTDSVDKTGDYCPLLNRISLIVALYALSAPGICEARGSASESEVQTDTSQEHELATPKGITKRRVIFELAQSPTGRRLLRDGQKKWGYSKLSDLEKILRWGEVSRTDAIVTRKYDSAKKREWRERDVTVYLRPIQSFDEIVLDLAHELIHAINDPEWDPYDPNLTQARYIYSAIEGQGGEIDALVSECQVSLELYAQDVRTLAQVKSRSNAVKRCYRYLDSRGHRISRDKVKEDIYRVGEHKSGLLLNLGDEAKLFTALSSDEPTLYSSTGNAPYPLSLAREYRELMSVACENSWRRLQAQGRRPSNDNDSTWTFVQKRCK